MLSQTVSIKYIYFNVAWMSSFNTLHVVLTLICHTVGVSAVLFSHLFLCNLYITIFFSCYHCFPVLHPLPKPQENVMEVTLTKNVNGLGFSFLMCEIDPPTSHFSSLVRIKQLFPGQPAEQSGRLQEGDVLLTINGQSLKDLSYLVCLKLSF